MFRAIIWKELREQGLIALTLIVFGGAILVAAAVLTDPPSPNAGPTDIIRFLGLGRLATLMLAVTAGMVCGGAVFAAEREAATFPYLDSLPTTRWQIWRAKFMAGLVVALMQIGLLIALGAALGLVSTIGWAMAVTLYAMLAFVWGILGSTSARTTLGSIGIAIPAASLTAFFVLIPVTLFFQSPGAHLPRVSGAILFISCMLLVPLALSAWIFTGLDRQRGLYEAPRLSPQIGYVVPGRGMRRPDPEGMPSRVPIQGDQPRSSSPRLGLFAILWLTCRQLLLPGLVLSSFAFLLGLTLLLPPIQPFIAWPALALTAGIVAGVLAFADEQSRGSARYWSEQRLPIGRVWAIKIGSHSLFCAGLLLVLAFPLIVRAQLGDPARSFHTHTFLAAAFRSPLFDELGPQGWKYLLVPAAYGFAAGHLCGLVFRKLVVACGVAGIVGGVGTALWMPSLLSGGVQHWQVWLPPLALLVTSFLLLRPWIAERMSTRPTLTRLAVGSGATLIVLAIGLGYRVLEVPDRPDGEEDIPFVASLPPIERNQSGRDFKNAAERYSRLASANSPLFDRSEIPIGQRRERIEEQVERVLRFGWPANDPQQVRWLPSLAEWLNTMFAPAPAGTTDPPWYTTAAEAAQAPVGVYEYPQFIGLSGSSLAALESARRMAIALLARGLQQQAAGDPDDFLHQFRITVALVRTLRNGSVVASYLTGVEIERLAIIALDRWLEQLPETSMRSRAAVEVAKMLEPAVPFDPNSYFLAERYVLREGMKAPAQWLPRLISTPGVSSEATAVEVDLVGLAWAVPWERERTRRIVGLGFESGRPTDYSMVIGRPGVGFLIGRASNPRDLANKERLLSAHRRAAVLKSALRAHRAQNGKYPDSLADLKKSQLLHQLPHDPFTDQQNYGYRLAQPPGEVLTSPVTTIDRGGGLTTAQSRSPSETLRVADGQPILWSIGQDHIDQQGRSLPVGQTLESSRPLDLVYLVPRGQ